MKRVQVCAKNSPAELLFTLIAKQQDLPSGKRLHNYGKPQFLMGKSTISMAIFNSYVTNYQRVSCQCPSPRSCENLGLCPCFV